MAKKDTKDYLITIAEMASENENGDNVAGAMEDNQTYAILDDATLPIRVYDPKDIEYSDAYVYAHDGFFYLYRGSCSKSIQKGPGIFLDPETKTYYMVEVDPENAKEADAYRIGPEHIVSFNKKKILDDLKQNAKNIYSGKEKLSRSFFPKINPTDDSLKRIMKMALLEKGIDIDHYRDRFADKNATFNFKQVIKSDAKLSMLLFERGAEAFNLRYKIIVEELDPNNPIGAPLTKPLVVTSTDTYDL